MTATPETEDLGYAEQLMDVSNNMGHRTDRQVLLNIESMMTEIRDLVADVAKECGPVIQQISGHAMFRMLFGKVKTDD
jgi:hypothetical protein